MWQYEFIERDVQRVIAPAWDLGTVRVSREVDRARDGSCNFVEQLLLRHLYHETGALQTDEATIEAIEGAHVGEKGYGTIFNYRGTVFKVKTHAGHRVTDVTVVEDDSFSSERLALSFEDLLQEQVEAQEDEEAEDEA